MGSAENGNGDGKPETQFPPWIPIAQGEIGQHEIRGGENPRIIAYHATTTLKATEDEVPWCSSFVNWCLTQAGYKGTNSAWARSWMGWGYACLQEPGCVVVLQRGNNAQTGHVGFFMGQKLGGWVSVLGGNQGDRVCLASFPAEMVLGYRWPNGSVSP